MISMMEAATATTTVQQSIEDGREHWVMVYGTLKQGFYNHYLISGSTTSKPGVLQTKHVQTKDPMVMVVNERGIPFLMERIPEDTGQVHKIQGELYRVDDGLLRELDILEGTPTFYCRKTLQIELTAAGGNDVHLLPDNSTAYVYVKSETTNPEENATLRLQQRYPSYTMEMHATYVPPPLRTTSTWLPQVQRVTMEYSRMYDDSSCENEGEQVRKQLFPEEQESVETCCSALIQRQSLVQVLDVGTGKYQVGLRAILQALSDTELEVNIWGIDCCQVPDIDTKQFRNNIESRTSILNAIDLYKFPDLQQFGKYDVILAMHVFIHIPVALHRHVMMTLYRLLAPDGRIMVSFPAETLQSCSSTESMFWERTVHHVEALLEECGYVVESCCTVPLPDDSPLRIGYGKSFNHYVLCIR